MRLSLFAVASVVLVAACGGSGGQPEATPTPSSEPTTTAVAGPPTGALDGLQLSVLVIYGCECPPPPSVGIIQVAGWLTGEERLDVIEAEIDHPSMSHPAAIPLSAGRVAGACNDPLGHYAGFSGSTRVARDDELPRTAADLVVVPPAGEIEVHLTLRAADGTEYEATVRPTRVCAAVS